MSLDPKISLIIPAYNEAGRISPTLTEYTNFLEQSYPEDYEILVVLNGCTDNTAEIVQKHQIENPNIQLLNFDRAIGKGGAVVEGFKAAKGRILAFTDADNSTKPDMLNRLFQILEIIPSIDCTIASRNVPGSQVLGKTQSRQILTLGFNLGVNLLFGLGIRDTQCGAKAVRKEIIDKILPYLTISNMAFDVNLLVDIKKAGGHILEVPIRWEDNLDSKIRNKFKTSLGMALSVLRLRIIYSPLKVIYPTLLQPISDFLYKFFKDRN